MKPEGSIVTTTMEVLDDGSRNRIDCNDDNRESRVNYLAFGSNLLPANITARNRAPSAQPVRRYLLEGWQLGIGTKSNRATIEMDEKSCTAAVLYTIARKELAELDLREGIGPKTRAYMRHEVLLGDDSRAYTYLVEEGITPGRLPDKCYFQKVSGGLEHWGFDEQLREFVARGYAKE